MKFELNVSLGLVWIGLNLFVLVGFKIVGFILDLFYFYFTFFFLRRTLFFIFYLDGIPFKLCVYYMIIFFYYEDERQQLIYNIKDKLRYFIEKF